MKSGRITFVVLFALAVASIATAQVKRTFVSAQVGNDANSCLPTSPCRNFARAIQAVDPGGEIVVLDSGGFGPFTVSKQVIVQAPPGVYAGCTVLAGTAITISAAGTDTVVLRGLALNGLGTGTTGIDFSTGGVLHLENVLVNGFATNGIVVNHNSSLFINDSTVRNGGGAGVNVGAATAMLSRCRFEKNAGAGVFVTGGATVMVSESISAGNSDGFAGNSSGVNTLTLDNCASSGNATGITAGSGPDLTIRVARSTITNNTTGLSVSGTPNLLSAQNNLVEGNGTDGTFTDSFLPK